MNSLTPQREHFAQLIAAGKTQADAYREAFPSSLTWKPATVWSRASELMGDRKVMGRVEELRGELRELELWSRAESVRRLRQVVETSERGSDIIAAVRELNAMHGYNAPQKREHSLGGGEPALQGLIAAVLGTTLPIRQPG